MLISADSPRRRNATRLLWLVILIGSFLARAIYLDRFDLGTDEAHSFLTATSSASLLTDLQQDTNPPLYFLLLKCWISVFGASLPAMRMLSVLAGTAMVAAVGALAAACGASKRTITWTLLLAGLTPIQIHYSQLARGYTLACLLFIVGILTFVRALKTADATPWRQWAAWIVHALTIALGVYTHNLIVPFCLGYPIAGLAMRIPKRQLLAMALSYAAAAVLTIPALMLGFVQQRSSGGLDWIIPYWLQTPPALAIPKSLEILALGGNMPRYLLALPLPFPLQLLAILLVAAAAAAFFWPRRIAPDANSAMGPTPDDLPPRYRPLIITFTFWPLLFLWGYSYFGSPIYLVGRYDLFAQPAYLLLLAAGFARLQSHIRRPALAAAVPLLVCLVFAADLFSRWTFPVDPEIFHHQQRVDYLAQNLRQNDIIICTGLEASPTLYHLRQRHIEVPLLTFPRETLSHIGWFISNEQIVARQDQWLQESLALLRQVYSVRTPAGAATPRIWILLDSALWNPPTIFAPSPRQQLTLDFLATAQSNGWHPETADPARQKAESDLRIVCLVPGTLASK